MAVEISRHARTRAPWGIFTIPNSTTNSRVNLAIWSDCEYSPLRKDGRWAFCRVDALKHDLESLRLYVSARSTSYGAGKNSKGKGVGKEHRQNRPGQVKWEAKSRLLRPPYAFPGGTLRPLASSSHAVYAVTSRHSVRPRQTAIYDQCRLTSGHGIVMVRLRWWVVSKRGVTLP